MKKSRQLAYTLVEMIAVLAIISGLAAALFVPMIRHLDFLAEKKEVETLQKMGEAFKERSLVTRVITNATGWATVVGTQLGLQQKVVTNNHRGLRRVFLSDPGLIIGTNGASSLPYIQSTNGHGYNNGSGIVVPPVNPRLMLISSLSAPLPSSLVTGVGDTSGPNAFTNIWSTPNGALPAGWSWNGRGEDLKIQRIDLSDLFVQLILNNRDTNLVPTFRIDSWGTNSVRYGGRKPMYFLKGSEVKLNNALAMLEYSEVLNTSQSFTFEFGTWQGEAFVANSVNQPSAVDLQRVMNQFMAAPTNQYAKFGAAQFGVSNAMVSFLTNYIAWRDAGFPGQFQGQGNPPNSVSAAQVQLENMTTHLISFQ